jgi:hypothetical protein
MATYLALGFQINVTRNTKILANAESGLMNLGLFGMYGVAAIKEKGVLTGQRIERIRYAPLKFLKTTRERFPAAVFRFELAGFRRASEPRIQDEIQSRKPTTWLRKIRRGEVK